MSWTFDEVSRSPSFSPSFSLARFAFSYRHTDDRTSFCCKHRARPSRTRGRQEKLPSICHVTRTWFSRGTITAKVTWQSSCHVNLHDFPNVASLAFLLPLFQGRKYSVKIINIDEGTCLASFNFHFSFYFHCLAIAAAKLI